MKINLFLLIFSTFYIISDDLQIDINITEQRLYLKENGLIIDSFPVSTSKYGEGSIQNSFKTPLGKHKIKTKIGKNADINTIFIARENSYKKADIIIHEFDTENDYVTSRIMWLQGLESGLNIGPGVDSYYRYIYIHGTHEEGLIGKKASHGCIRMFNDDVIYLFDKIREGTNVQISY